MGIGVLVAIRAGLDAIAVAVGGVSTPLVGVEVAAGEQPASSPRARVQTAHRFLARNVAPFRRDGNSVSETGDATVRRYLPSDSRGSPASRARRRRDSSVVIIYENLR
jgi:hypothetical protein